MALIIQRIDVYKWQTLMWAMKIKIIPGRWEAKMIEGPKRCLFDPLIEIFNRFFHSHPKHRKDCRINITFDYWFDRKCYWKKSYWFFRRRQRWQGKEFPLFSIKSKWVFPMESWQTLLKTRCSTPKSLERLRPINASICI